ncbi:hypothetical protein [Sorangium sp. So ce542]|uniref:hypothetical protein n=1 Tax=Sorangium sp. So ce542 TaxID=3133316 RepID=UPI003F62D0EE
MLTGEVEYIGARLALGRWRSEQPPDRLVRHAGTFDVAGGDGQAEPLPKVGEQVGSRRPRRHQRALVSPSCGGGSARAY